MRAGTSELATVPLIYIAREYGSIKNFSPSLMERSVIDGNQCDQMLG